MEIFKKRARWIVRGPEGLRKFPSLAAAEAYIDGFVSARLPITEQDVEEIVLLEEVLEDDEPNRWKHQLEHLTEKIDGDL